ncbi:MAG TPA: response regulator [Rhizobacter sp.]|nr:response regulator [Rhizobacter sp.]
MGADEGEADERVSILVVDDLPEKLLVFRTVLEELNQDLVFVRSGREALREVLQREFAVILLDVNMPDIDGFETAALIRQYKRAVDTPIIFITSYADEIQTERGYALGAVDYILSPVVPHILRSKVRVFVRLFAMQRQIKRQSDARAAIAAAEAARRAAEEAGRRKDEFLAMLSHELRNPLAPIRTALEVIRRIAPHDPKLDRASDIMVRQVRQMTRLIDELLDVARISQGKIVLTRERVDINAVISQSVETAQPLIDSRGQTLRVQPLAEPMWLQGDFARLAQIISNLLNNASKYSEKGTLIELTASLDAQGAAIRVRDQGIGIEPQLLPRIFDLFTQGSRGLDRAQGGLGVGLTLAQRLAEMHGGQLSAESAGPGEGSEFTLRLPCVGLVSGGEQAAAAAEQPAAPTCRVLVVDDNRDAAQSVATFLELGGHEVRTAADGGEALAAAGSFAPDVVVLDIGLPVLDGYAVAHRLRQSAATRDALLLALTGYGQREDRLLADAAGFNHHFVKPADPSALLACIENWLRARTAARQALSSA